MADIGVAVEEEESCEEFAGTFLLNELRYLIEPSNHPRPSLLALGRARKQPSLDPRPLGKSVSIEHV